MSRKNVVVAAIGIVAVAVAAVVFFAVRSHHHALLRQCIALTDEVCAAESEGLTAIQKADGEFIAACSRAKLKEDESDAAASAVFNKAYDLALGNYRAELRSAAKKLEAASSVPVGTLDDYIKGDVGFSEPSEADDHTAADTLAIMTHVTVADHRGSAIEEFLKARRVAYKKKHDALLAPTDAESKAYDHARSENEVDVKNASAKHDDAVRVVKRRIQQAHAALAAFDQEHGGMLDARAKQRIHDVLLQVRIRLRDSTLASKALLDSTQAAWDRQTKMLTDYALSHSFKPPITDGDLVTAKMMMEDEAKTKIEWPDLGGAAVQFARDKASLEEFDHEHIGIAQELGYKVGEW